MNGKTGNKAFKVFMVTSSRLLCLGLKPKVKYQCMLYLGMTPKFNYNRLCPYPDMDTAAEAHTNVIVVYYILNGGISVLQVKHDVKTKLIDYL